MSSQVFVDPHKLEELIKRLNSHTTDMVSKQKSMNGYIKNLQSSWNDVQYKSFVEQYNEFNKRVEIALKESETVLIPHLRNLKKLAEEYKNLKRG